MDDVLAARDRPANCRQVPNVTDDELELDWYRDLVYRQWRVDRIEWERPGRSRPLKIGDATLLYLRLVPLQDGELRIGRATADAEPQQARRYELHRGASLELRVKLSDLGEGDRLFVSPPTAVREARIFEARPR